MNEEMESLAGESQRLLESLAPNIWVEATIVILAGLIFAKLADLWENTSLKSQAQTYPTPKHQYFVSSN